MVPAGSLQGLDGTVGVTDHDFSRLPVPWNLVYSVGDRFCHQMEDRTVVLGGNEMAFCARCTGVWLGLFAGLLLISFFEIPLDSSLVWIFIFGLIPMAVDGGGQLLGLWESFNFVRLLTGFLAGVVGGVAIGILIDEVKIMFLGKNRKTSGKF